MQPPTRPRRGNYALVSALVVVPLLGLAALGVDWSMVQATVAESDATAYAAAHTALVVYQRTGDADLAEARAASVVALNPVGTRTASLVEVRFGRVDPSSGAFHEDADLVEAAEATVTRSGGNGVELILGPVLGQSRLDVASVGVASDVDYGFVDDCGGLLADVGDLDAAWGDHVGPHELDPHARLVSLTVSKAGWYDLYKEDVANSGSAQLNESAYVRVRNDGNPLGAPRQANCGEEWVVVDYDNGGRVYDRVFLGTFWLEEGAGNVLEMRHYCEIRAQCPGYEEVVPGHGCADEDPNIVHMRLDTPVCLEVP